MQPTAQAVGLPRGEDEQARKGQNRRVAQLLISLGANNKSPIELLTQKNGFALRSSIKGG
jgi:hypothetical protein